MGVEMAKGGLRNPGYAGFLNARGDKIGRGQDAVTARGRSLRQRWAGQGRQIEEKKSSQAT